MSPARRLLTTLTLEQAPGTRVPEVLPGPEAAGPRAVSGTESSVEGGGEGHRPPTRKQANDETEAGRGDTFRSSQHGERRTVGRGTCSVQFSQDSLLTGPQRETSPGSQAGSCFKRVGAAPRGQGSFSRASTVRHVSAEKVSFCCHHMPFSPRQPVT